MKEKITQLQNILGEIAREIEQTLIISDLISQKNENTFFDDDIPKLKSLLIDGLSKLPATHHRYRD